MAELEFHENLAREDEVVGSSDRAFGLTLAGVGIVIGALKLWQGRETALLWLAAAAVFCILALSRPSLLAPLNRLWLRFGLLLYKFVNPVVMAAIFYSTVLPTGLIMRALGKDLLRLRREPDAPSYWIVREPAGPAAETMKHQF